jgi:cell migration-inducing and hyaluronan-binding protein
VPDEGDAVTIVRDVDVVLDVSPPPLRSLTIQGKLRFSDERDVELETEWIYVPGGELEIGSEARCENKRVCTFTPNKSAGAPIDILHSKPLGCMSRLIRLQ